MRSRFDPRDWATGSSQPRLTRVDEAMAGLETAEDLVDPALGRRCWHLHVPRPLAR